MTWVAVGVAAVGAVTSIAGGISGKKAAEAAGKRQAQIIEATSRENQRRRELDLQENLGAISAGVHSSNIQMSGSAARYKAGFETNYRSEMAWDKQKARMDARTAKKGGQLAGQQAMFAGVGSAITSVGQGFSAAPGYLGKQKGPG